MKDLTEYFDTENFYKDTYGDAYSKSLRRDIKRSKQKKILVLLMPAISLPTYFGILLLTGTVIEGWHFLMSAGMVCMQIPGMLNLKNDIERFKKSANLNLQELIRLLFRNEVDTNCEKLKNGVLTHKKEKENIEYREVETNKKVINHAIKTEETRLYFKDIDEKLKCLREMRQIITFQDLVEKTHTLELLEEQDLIKEEIPNKVKKKLMQ